MNLLLEQECRRKYVYNTKNQAIVMRVYLLIQLKQYITEETVDQLPPLVDLQRYLEELSIMQPPENATAPLSIRPVHDLTSYPILNLGYWTKLTVRRLRGSKNRDSLVEHERTAIV
jgi:hypothetical protein